jgi:hypothetical protein
MISMIPHCRNDRIAFVLDLHHLSLQVHVIRLRKRTNIDQSDFAMPDLGDSS